MSMTGSPLLKRDVDPAGAASVYSATRSSRGRKVALAVVPSIPRPRDIRYDLDVEAPDREKPVSKGTGRGGHLRYRLMRRLD